MNASLRRRLAAAVTAAAAVALIMTGCSAAGSIATETVRGVAPGITLSADEGLGEVPVAVWTDDRATLTVITWGSSGCPGVPTALTVSTPETLDLRFAPPTDAACTADFAPTSHVFATPAGVETGDISIDITFEGRTADETLEVTVPVRD
jgi:hypothetical protein